MLCLNIYAEVDSMYTALREEGCANRYTISQYEEGVRLELTTV